MNSKKKYVLTPKQFAFRILRYFLISLTLLLFSLFLGVLGYHYYAELGWIDSLLNASMILAGMGPVDLLITDNAKIFASVYALFSGIVFLGTVAIFFAPIAHRLLHLLHVDQDENKETEN